MDSASTRSLARFSSLPVILRAAFAFLRLARPFFRDNKKYCSLTRENKKKIQWYTTCSLQTGEQLR